MEEDKDIDNEDYFKVVEEKEDKEDFFEVVEEKKKEDNKENLADEGILSDPSVMVLSSLATKKYIGTIKWLKELDK